MMRSVGEAEQLMVNKGGSGVKLGSNPTCTRSDFGQVFAV